MSKVTGVTLAAHVAEQSNANPNASFGKILLDAHAVQATLAAAEAMERAYESADQNFQAMETAKSTELDRSIAALNLARPADHKASAMREWRQSALKHFESVGALEAFRAAQNLLDVVRVTEDYNRNGPVNLAGRHGLIGDTAGYREAWDRVNGAGAMELRNVATVAMATKNKDLAAACVRRLQQMNKEERASVGVTHHQLAGAAFGDDYKQLKHSLGVIRDKSNRTISRFRSRQRGGDGDASSLSKIARGLNEIQRGPVPPTPSVHSLSDGNGRYRLPKDVMEICKRLEGGDE